MKMLTKIYKDFSGDEVSLTSILYCSVVEAHIRAHTIIAENVDILKYQTMSMEEKKSRITFEEVTWNLNFQNKERQKFHE